MSNIIKRVWNQNKMVNIEALQGMAFQAEDGGHTFEISGVDDDGNAVPLSGTVAGAFMRPDKADIALVGTASGGVVSVTLSDACYAVTGKFGLTIFVTDGNNKKTAVYAAVGTVVSTTGGAVAGDTPQDVVDLINAIEAAVTSIPASYTNLMGSIAPTYSSSALYPVGSYVWYDGTLYRCTTAITTAETWTSAHWTSTTLSNTEIAYRGTLTSSDDMNLITRPGIYDIDSSAGYPAHLPFDPHNGKVFVQKNPSTSNYSSVSQIYFTNYVRKRVVFRTSKSADSAANAWNGVEWTEIVTEETAKGVDNINGERVRIPLIPATMQSTGRYSSVSTSRIRPVNSYSGLFDFKLAGYKVKFYYYSSKYDYEEASESVDPTNFLHTTAWQDIDDYVSPERGMWCVFMIGKQGDGAISATDLEYVRENLEVYSTEEPSIFMQTNTVPYNAITYHGMWDSLVDGAVVKRTLLGNAGNDSDYPIYAYEIHTQRNSMTYDYQNVYFNGSNEQYPRKKVLIFAGTHGNEKCTPMDVFALARELVKGGLQDIGAMFDWYIVPLTNPWGYSHVNLDANGNIIYRYGTVAQTVDATADRNAGVRANASGMDINRDFSDNTFVNNGVTYGFQTSEAQILRTYILANKWDIFIDVHQNNQDKYIGMSPGCNAFAGTAYKTSNNADYLAKLNKIYLTIDNACRNTNKNLSEYFRRKNPSGQAFVLWKRQSCDDASVSLGIASNYMSGFPTGTHGNTEHADIAADECFVIETSELAWTYSQLSNQTNTPYVSWYNPVACTCSTTALCELVKSIANSYAFLV